MKIEYIKEHEIHLRYYNAAQDIINYTTRPDRFSAPLETEFFSLEDLLQRQAQVLNTCNERAGQPLEFQDAQANQSAQSKPPHGRPEQGLLTMMGPGEEDGPAQKAPRLDPSLFESKLEVNQDAEPKIEPEIDLPLALQRIETVSSFSHQKFYAYPYELVPECWKCLYTDSLVLRSYYHLLRLITNTGEEADEVYLDKIIYDLDHALISTDGQSRALKNGKRWIAETMIHWRAAFDSLKEYEEKSLGHSQAPERFFSDTEPFGRIKVQKTIPRLKALWSVEKFEKFMTDPAKPPIPLIIPGLIDSWPAMNERSWKSMDYLLNLTLGGRRQVPIEIGRSYVDDDWGQIIIPFKTFLENFILGDEDTERDVGYLAQHELFRQIPSLRNDIQIPDYCWVDTSGHPLDQSKNKPKLDTPNINAWFGPAKTITPLHTDGYHNLLCQVVGTKFVRLYAPSCAAKLKPLENEDGVDMSNTSSLDIGMLEGWDPPHEDMTKGDVKQMARQLDGVEYQEYILKPGDTLLIPMGWWHYVRSLSVSFSVSFWWN